MAEEPIEQDYALIIQQPGKAEQTLVKFGKMLLSYQYGLNTEIVSDFTVSDFTKVRSVLRQGAGRMRCSFVIQSKAVSAHSTVPVPTAPCQCSLTKAGFLSSWFCPAMWPTSRRRTVLR